MKKTIHKLVDGQLLKFIETLLDLAVILGTLFVFAVGSHYLTNGSFPNIFDKFIENVLRFSEYFPYVILALIIFHIYRPSIFERSYLSVMKSVVLSLVMINFLLFIFTLTLGSDMAFSPMTIIAILFLQIAIFAVYKFIMHRLFSKVIMKKVMIIGPKREALALALKFHTDSDHNKEIHSIIFEINHQVSDDFYDLVHDIDDVYLTPSLSDNIKYSLMQYTIAKAYRNIYVVPKTHEISFMNAKDDSIDDILLLHLPAFGITHEQRFLKRSFDLIVSLLGLIILAPFFLIFSILIKLEDGGPIFFKQLRYKRHNKPFKVYKFRTMSVNQHADQINKRASINDNRITRVGKFLRATRFDELAQLINVVKSEMSIVGPRPLIIEEIEEAAREIPEFYFRSNVKPGLTGLAQIKGKYDTEASEKIRYDLLYVTKQSFWFDLKIIILTVRTIFTKGSVIQNDSKKTFQDFLKEKHISYIETENLIKIL